MSPIAAIFGCAGEVLSESERAFFRAARPWGFILFARNVRTPNQVRALVDSLRETAGWHAPVLIDQEGGRVARLKPPHWPIRPPMARIGAVWDGAPEEAEAAAWLDARLIANDLCALGIDVDCAPVLDVPAPGGHDIIGDRAFGTDPGRVATLGRAFAQGLLDGGVLPILKHIPGHGRAGADSHLDLPVVEAGLDALDSDFAPFRALADMPLAMTAHVAYAALDGGRPATLSALVIEGAIRGRIGFRGVLMSDDLGMHALGGPPDQVRGRPFGQRAAESLAAGCDLVLHCSGDLAEMEAVAAATGPLDGVAAERCDAALARRRPPRPFDAEDAERRLAGLLALAA